MSSASGPRSTCLSLATIFRKRLPSPSRCREPNTDCCSATVDPSIPPACFTMLCTATSIEHACELVSNTYPLDLASLFMFASWSYQFPVGVRTWYAISFYQLSMCSFLVSCLHLGWSLRRHVVAMAHKVLAFHHFYLHFSDSGSGYSLIALAKDIP